MRINPKIYSLDVVHLAAYAMLGKTSVFVEGDPEKEIIVNFDEKYEKDFLEELAKAAVYIKKSEEDKVLKSDMLKSTLFGSAQAEEKIEDPDDILVPWEEKYG